MMATEWPNGDWVTRLQSLKDSALKGGGLDDEQIGVLYTIIDQKPDPEKCIPAQLTKAQALAAVKALLPAGAGLSAGGAGLVFAAATGASVPLTPKDAANLFAALPPLAADAYPNNAEELEALLFDFTGIRIPVNAGLAADSNLQALSDHLVAVTAAPQLPNIPAANTFTFIIQNSPGDAGSELTTTFSVYLLLSAVFKAVQAYMPPHLSLSVQLNVTERQAGSRSSAVPPRDRPDGQVVYSSATMMILEDKLKGNMMNAIEDLSCYVKGGLPAAQFGDLPGILGCATAGLDMQLCYISRGGTVQVAGPVLDLDTIAGRLQAVCVMVNCYRVMCLMVNRLPPLYQRQLLWQPMSRGRHTTVMLVPTGARKEIQRFKEFAKENGTNYAAIQAAYQAAAAAAKEQAELGRQPFLVHSVKGSTLSRGTLYVDTTPLGYRRRISTEQDARAVATCVLQATQVLHSQGIVHSDIRMDNVLWVDDQHAMLIDLENCRRAAEEVPKGLQLTDWDAGTLEKRRSKHFYTAASDLYQLGRLLQKLPAAVVASDSAHAFIQMLRSKHALAGGALTAEAALQHQWMQQQ